MEGEDEEDEGFVSIGSAFEYLETDEDVVKAKEKKDKEFYVLDKQGRRRFHGAFTGGFSAGYFMSVGTKEGWSPAPFVSSRSQKATKHQQRPEDYMDEEDLDSFGIAPRQVTTRDKFTQEKALEVSSRKRPSIIPGDPILHTLVVPAKTTIGAQLMKSMGWREGKGVGPTFADPKVKVYGCLLPGSDSGYMEFAPNDVSSWDFSGKSNVHGIGYKGMTREHFGGLQFNKGIYGMSGQAFGVGALEEEDEDLFTQDTVASYHTSLGLPSDAEQSSSYGWTGEKGLGETWSLASFTKSSTRCHYSKVYPPPTIPRGFIPVHKFSVASSAPPTEDKPLKSISERGYVTGDRSVFDLVSPRDKERLKKVKEKKEFKMDDYQPFSGDTEKQARYEAYLQGSRSHTGSSDKSLTEWEKQKEQKEFDRLARVHKPLTTALSDRFTKGSLPEEEVVESVTPADVEMFGLMTREVIDWHPHRVLCKRFNIPDPFPNSDVVGIPSKQSSSNWRQQTMKFEGSTSTTEPAAEPIPNLYKGEITSTAAATATVMEQNNEQETVEVEQSMEDEQQEEERPSVTLLKSIFAESSSDEEDEDESTTEPHPSSTAPQPLSTAPHPSSNAPCPSSTATELRPPSNSTISALLENRSNEIETRPSNNRLLPPQTSKQNLSASGTHTDSHSRSEVRSGYSESQRHMKEPAPDRPSFDKQSELSKDTPWQNLAQIIAPTLSTPQKLEEPLVYVRETFGPALPPPLENDDNSMTSTTTVANSNSVDRQHSKDKNKRRHKDKHKHKEDETNYHQHHRKTKRKHHHKHRHHSHND